MALEKIMPDDMNEVACAMLVYIGEQDRQAGIGISYGDFGKLLQKNHGKRAHGGAYNDCIIHGRADKIHITTISGNEYDMTWNKIAKFIHPYLLSTPNTETVETTDNETADIAPAADTETAVVFDYSTVDDDIAQYLRKAAQKIANSYADIGTVLAEAQQKLAKHGFGDENGVFRKWFTSIGLKKDAVYTFIRIHNYREHILRMSEIPTNEDRLSLFDNLPKTLQADISSPSAPAEAVNAVLSGDITTHKDFIALKKELEEAKAWNEKLSEENVELTGRNSSLESRAADLGQQNDLLREENEKLSGVNEELDSKNNELELENKELRSQPQDAIIPPDPTESKEYQSLKDDYNKISRLIAETTQENDRLKDKQKELLGRYNELYERAKAAADSSGRELTGYFLPVSVDEYLAICQQLKGTKYAELLYKAKLIKF